MSPNPPTAFSPLAFNDETTNDHALTYLTKLLNKTLRIHTTDTRIFVGQLKCTDRDRNLILSMTHEYRHPSAQAVRDAVGSVGRVDDGEGGKEGVGGKDGGGKVEGQAPGEQIRGQKVTLDMVKRFVGLVVVPGQYITRIEVE